MSSTGVVALADVSRSIELEQHSFKVLLSPSLMPTLRSYIVYRLLTVEQEEEEGGVVSHLSLSMYI